MEASQKRGDAIPAPPPDVSTVLPEGPDRARLAYLLALGRPEFFEMLEHLDPERLREALSKTPELATGLEKRFPSAAPNPLWAVWLERVHPEKLR